MASNFELINEIDKRDNDFEEIDEFMPTERLPNAPKPVVRRGKEKSYMIIEEFDTNSELLCIWMIIKQSGELATKTLQKLE